MRLSGVACRLHEASRAFEITLQSQGIRAAIVKLASPKYGFQPHSTDQTEHTSADVSRSLVSMRDGQDRFMTQHKCAFDNAICSAAKEERGIAEVCIVPGN